MTCNCNELVDAKLKERNTRLSLAMVFSDPAYDSLIVQTEQIEKGRGKAKATIMFPSYCPFCGVGYDRA